MLQSSIDRCALLPVICDDNLQTDIDPDELVINDGAPIVGMYVYYLNIMDS